MKDFSTIRVRRYSNVRVAIVASRYHSAVTEKLVEGAKEILLREVDSPQIETFWVGGAFELPQAVSLLATSKKFELIIPVGCLVEGETKHFDFIANAVAQGLDEVGRNSKTPVAFGVLTVSTLEQAQERAGGKWGNKGEEAALAALSLLQVKKELSI